MPDPVAPTIGIVADLTFEVGGDDRRTWARLTGGPEVLVLDVDDPAVLLRSVPSGARRSRVPSAGLADLLSDTTIRVRSGGSELGSIRFARGRHARVRPTPAGLAVAGRQVARWRPLQLAVGAIGVALVAVKLIGARRAR